MKKQVLVPLFLLLMIKAYACGTYFTIELAYPSYACVGSTVTMSIAGGYKVYSANSSNCLSNNFSACYYLTSMSNGGCEAIYPAGVMTNIQWYIDGSPVSGANSSSFQHQFSTTGKYRISVTATCANGAECGESIDDTYAQNYIVVVGNNFNCSADYTHMLSGHTATFTAFPTSFVTGGSTVPHEDKTDYQVHITSIDFGDGANSSCTNFASVSHTYTDAGQYNVCVYYTCLCSTKSVCKTICITDPKAMFYWTRSGNSVTYHAYGVSGATYTWDFGNSTTGTGQNPAAVNYASSGVYTVTLTVDVGTGCTNTVQKEVCVMTLDASFSVSTVNSTTRSFSPTTPGGVNYLWNFGDGATSTAQNPSHTFSDGLYHVTLTVSNDACGSLSSSQDICINNSNADFNWVVLNDRYVQFSAQRQSGVTYTWDFGDGSASGSGQNPVHTYSSDGIYSVQLTVSGYGGCSGASLSHSICIARVDPSFDYSMDNSTGIATFTGSPSGFSYSWNFGDGGTSSSQSPSHTYTSSGDKTVTFTAYKSGNCPTATVQKTICVYLPIGTPGITVSQNWICVGSSLDFTGSALDAGVLGWFVDGVFMGEGSGKTIRFDQEGTFNVVLKARSGCSGESADEGLESDPPTQITVYTTKVNTGFKYQYTGTQVTLIANDWPASVKRNLDLTWTLKDANGTEVWTASGNQDDAKQVTVPSTVAAGKYTACLSVHNECATKEICRPICIGNGVVDCCPGCTGTQ